MAIDDDDLNFLMGPPEFFQRFSGRYFGFYKAIVKRNDDPKKMGRVKVIQPEIYGDYDHSPWCWPCTPFGGTVDTGMLFVPELDSYVWIGFEEGSPEHPFWIGCFWEEIQESRPDDGSPLERHITYQANTNPVPMHAQGILDGSDVDGGLKGRPGVPKSAFRGKYPHVRIIRTRAGHFLEFDDTKDHERIQIHHKSGAHIEMLPDGTINIISPGTLRTFGQAKRERIEGSVEYFVGGSRRETVAGDYILNIGGTYRVSYGQALETTYPSRDQRVTGEDKMQVDGKTSLNILGDYELAIGGEANLGSMGNLSLTSGGALTISASNTRNVAGPLIDALTLVGFNGKVSLISADPTGALSQFGVEAISQDSNTRGSSPTPGGIGPLVRLGNLKSPPLSSPTRLLQEPMVMGLQLVDYLTQLHSFLNGWLMDYISHAHPWYSPAFTATVQGPLLTAQFQALDKLFLTPSGPKFNSILLSDVVAGSKT